METDPVSSDDQLDELLERLERAEPATAVSPAGQLAAALEHELDPE